MVRVRYLLLDLAVGKNVFHWDIKLAHVIFLKPVFIPANEFEQWDPSEGHIQTDLPFWI